jgi:hypothetical protein
MAALALFKWEEMFEGGETLKCLRMSAQNTNFGFKLCMSTVIR